MVDEGICCVYLNFDNLLCVFIVVDFVGVRKNMKDNMFFVVYIDMVLGEKIEVMIVVKGGGFENKLKMVMLNFSDDIVDWVVKILLIMGVGWCLSGMLGIGIGGIVEKVVVFVKESFMDLVDI